jgi:predicted nucleic acid-binding protein
VATLCLLPTSSCSNSATPSGSEFGNTLWKKVRLGEFARDDGDTALAALRNGPVGLVATISLVERALHLAYEIEHPLYDCVYLAAAEAVAATVATADPRFFERCSQSSVRSRIAWIADWPSAR